MNYEEMREKICIQNLFRAVLMLAAKDAFGVNAQAKRRIKLRKDALEFFSDEADLRLVCELADVHFEDITKVVSIKNIKNKEKYNKIIACFFKK